MNVKIKLLNKKIQPPSRATELAAGVDLRANLSAKVAIHPNERRLIGSGIAVSVPPGLVGFVCPRSGLALKHGVTVANAPGCIDPDYTAEIGVILENRGDEVFWVNPGDRIAQLVFTIAYNNQWEIVDELPKTQRGDNGFGSTGTK